MVISALNKTDKHDHYVLAGKGELEYQLKAIAEEYGVAERVHILGFRTDIQELYKASDVCVFPSIREGLGLAGEEGMASGLPMIVADNRGTRSFVGSENGIVCRYDDVDGFAMAINEFYGDKYRCERIKDRNIKRSKGFDTTVVENFMCELYNQT